MMLLRPALFVLACSLSFLFGCWLSVWWCKRLNHCILGQRNDVEHWQKKINESISREMRERLQMRVATKKALKDTGEHLAIGNADSAGAVQPTQAQEDTTRKIVPPMSTKGKP